MVGREEERPIARDQGGKEERQDNIRSHMNASQFQAHGIFILVQDYSLDYLAKIECPSRVVARKKSQYIHSTIINRQKLDASNATSTKLYNITAYTIDEAGYLASRGRRPAIRH
jgi:hypothetical protein